MYSDELLALCNRLFRELIRFLGNNVVAGTLHELVGVFGDRETNVSLVEKLKDKEAVEAQDMAEDLFRKQSINKGIFCLMLAFSKHPNLGGLDGYIHSYMVHKVGSKKNWSIVAEGATKIVNATWDLLSDSRRRASYDRLIGCNQPQPPEKRRKP
ncbi:hypothetical protein LWI28_023170 [Acer negundo]|uniref:Uncharacterized protein n=1 Tax=Acer negundo TaxID=4023 RepID=A0AAD5IDY8_ACENE|nr:hypothetical protein LWI28_023170 [Acer negundo]